MNTIVEDYSRPFKEIILSNRKLFLGVTLSLLFSSGALGVQRTILTLYTNSLDKNLNKYLIIGAAISLSIFGVSKAFGNYFGGIFSDRKGRNLSSKTGLVFVFLGSIVILFGKNLIQFFFGNSLVGFGLGILFASSAILLTDISTPLHRAKALSLMELSVYLGQTIGAFFAGNLLSYNFFTIFLIALIMVIISIIFNMNIFETKNISQTENYLLPQETNLINKLKQLNTEFKTEFNSEGFLPKDFEFSDESYEDESFNKMVLLKPSFILTFFSGILSRVSDTIVIILFPIVLLLLNLNGLELGIITSSFTLFWAIGIAIAGPLSDKIGRKSPLFLGFVLEAFGYILMFLIGLQSWLPILIIGTIISGFGRGLYFPIPSSLSTEFVNPTYRGTVLGIYRFMLDSGYLFGSIFLIALIETRPLSHITFYFYQPIFLILVLIFIIHSILIVAVIKDPKPGFKQIDMIFEHLKLVDSIYDHITKGLNFYNIDDIKQMKNEIIISKNYERKADTVLESIIKKTYAGTWKATDSLELLEFSTKIDKAAGQSIHAIRKLNLLNERIPYQFSRYLIYYGSILQIMMESIKEVIELIPIRIKLAASHTYLANMIEEVLDEIHRILWKEVTELNRDKEFTNIFYILLTQLIDHLEASANTLEDAAEMIRLISFKHS